MKHCHERLDTATIKQSTCDGKQSFDKFKNAKRAAKRRRGRQAYHCPFCHQWHVGTGTFMDKRMKEV